MKRYFRDYRIKGTAESIIQFELLASLINHCSINGQSRKISVCIDAKGASNIVIHRKEEGQEFFDNPVEINMDAVRVVEEAACKKFMKMDEEKVKKPTEEYFGDHDQVIDFLDGHSIAINIGD